MSNASQPECYGQDWDQNAAECAGGYDPAYVAANGSHIRKKCDCYDACKVRYLLKQANSGQNVQVPVNRLTQQQAPWPWPAAPSPWQPQQPAPIRQGQPVSQAQQPQNVQMMQLWQQAQQQMQMQQLMQMLQAMQSGADPRMAMMQPSFLFPPAPQNIPYQMAPLQMMPAYYDMPAYLSAPEPVLKEESLLYPLGREILRGMGKALGHSIAHFFDHVAFGGR